MKLITSLFVAGLVSLVFSSDSQAGLIRQMRRAGMPVAIVEQGKLFSAIARHRFSGQTVEVYRGPSREQARAFAEIWDDRPGWKAEVVVVRF
jgi:hypothetical protein